MVDGKLRIGILGAARIARKNATAIAHPESACVVVAVASRTRSKAEDFVKDFVKASAAIFGGDSAYDDLVNSHDICDAIYIPLPTMLHKEWVFKALRAGKHVLVEKPVAMCVEDYEEMLQVARETGKFLMDGTMFPHHNRTHDLIACARDETQVGRVDRIETSFSFLGDEAFFQNDIRTKIDGDPMGCIGDLGWYCIRMALLIFPTKPASARVVDFKLTSDGVPISASCLVHFEGDRVLVFQCGFLTPLRQSLDICGSKRRINMDDYVLPKGAPLQFDLHTMSLTENDLLTIHDKDIVLCEAGPVQEVLMWQNFSRFVRSVRAGSHQWAGDEAVSAIANAEMSLMNQKVLNALIDSIRLAEAVNI